MSLTNEKNEQIAGWGGLVTYEADFYCLAKDTGILINRSNEIFISNVQDIIDGDKVLSVDKNGNQLWKNAYLTKRSAPNNLRQLRAGNLINITHTHKLFKPKFEIEAAGNLLKEDKIMSVSKLSLPTTRKQILWSDLIKNPPEWLIFKENKIGHFYRKEEVLINNTVELSREFGLLIGLYLAEGSTNTNVVQFAFHEKEDEISNIIENVCCKIFDNNISTKTKVFPQYTRRIVYIFNKTVKYLMSNFLSGNCYTKKIPYWCFDAPNEFKLGLLQGWIFGDGGFNIRSIRGTSVSRSLIDGMHNIALSLGITSSISCDENNQHPVYRLIISGKNNFEQLFPFDVAWKHYEKIKEYCDINKTKKSYTLKQLSEIFHNHYVPGMTKYEFLNTVNMNGCSFIRIFKSWNNLLKYFGYSDYIKQHTFTRKELLIIGWRWIKSGKKFSELNWEKDLDLPSIGQIYKHFGKSSIFTSIINCLSENDIIKMSESDSKILNNIFNHKITFIQDINYEEDYVYDLRVEDNENFLIGNILSHNSGSQIQILIGDILIDNAIGISYQVRGESVPVYGFGSEYYTYTAKSPVLVIGQLTIAFKESFYLLAPAARFHNRTKLINELTTPRYSDTRGVGFKTLDSASAAAHKGGWVKYRNTEQLFEHLKSQREGGIGVPGGLVKQLGALQDSEWENCAERFEDAIWYGSDIQSPETRNALFSNTISDHETDKIDFKTIQSHRRLDQYPAVDIWITYGDMEAPDSVNHTVEKILDVHFTGEGKEIVVGGEPILEVHSFIARNRV